MHRTEIDGLRAFAVVPVILFHAGFEVFSGGFVGVDVFFVISGFLITGILLREFEKGTFSILRFYERRARRILPAFFVVCLACLPFAWAWMMPDQLSDFGRSLIATQLFLSNIQFWREAGYFSSSSELKPLLHTWSLAIEEQYYVFFPLLLAALWRPFGRKGLFVLLAAIALGSLALAHVAAPRRPDFAFYLLPTRAWELLAGALCAFIDIRHKRLENSALGLLGLLLILGAVFLYDGTEPFPSLWAVPPVLGTGLILLCARNQNVPARILSFSPFVMIGLISYSAYLWHQPIFAFARIRSLDEPGPLLMLGLALLSLPLGYLSWRFVEAPFRKGNVRILPLLPLRRDVFAASAIGIVALAGLGFALIVSKGVPERLSAEVIAYSKTGTTDLNPLRDHCLYNLKTGAALPNLPNPACILQPGVDRPRAIIIGDSHGDAISPAAAAVLVAAGFAVEQVTFTACAPFPGYEKSGWQCGAAANRLLTYLETVPFDLIVLSMRPHPLFYHEGFDNGEGGVEPSFTSNVSFDRAMLGIATDASDFEALQAVFTQGISRLLSFDTPVVLIYPVPEAGWHVPTRAAKRLMFHSAGTEEITTSRARYDARNAPFFDIYDAIPGDNLIRLFPAERLCDSSRCTNTKEGKPLYLDDDHLSGLGAQLVMSVLVDRLQAWEARTGQSVLPH